MVGYVIGATELINEYQAQWIPAFVGMTVQFDDRLV